MKLEKLPRFNDDCCLKSDSECTQEEFEMCESDQTTVYIWEQPSGYDEPIYREHCITCGGLSPQEWE